MIILGVETSCDETSVAVLKDGIVLSNIVISQIDIHKKYGGVVPEVASRHHIYQIVMVFIKALEDAFIKPEDVDYIAVTKGPGLIGSLLVGINASKTFAMIYNKPIIGVNHLVGHIYANAIENEMKFPLISLVVSGGNTLLVYMKDDMNFKVIGDTLDDAVGECYDKVARTLNLEYPGGPIIDKLSKSGKNTYEIPYPKVDGYNFSFSGIKSHVLNIVNKSNMKNEKINIEDLCFSFQDLTTTYLVDKTIKAAKDYNVKNIIIAGGVSANSMLREKILSYKDTYNINIPKLSYTTDNAIMICMAAHYMIKKGYKFDNLLLDAIPDLELE